MIHPILAKLAANPEFTDAFMFIITGLLLVIGALLVLSGLISVIGTGFRRNDPKKPAAAPAPAPAAAAAPVATQQPAPASAPAPAPAPAPVAAPAAADPMDTDVPIAALIAAAIHVALEGRPHRVLHIEPVSVGWAREGRREIFSSHRFR